MAKPDPFHRSIMEAFGQTIDLDEPGPMTGEEVRRQTTRGVMGKDGKVDWIQPTEAGYAGPAHGLRRANSYDVDNDPGAQDFDADEYIESNVPKPYEREGVTRVNSRAEHEAEVKTRDRAIQDRAARQASEVLAQYQQQLAQPSAVQARLDDQKAQEDAQRRLLAIQYLRGGQ